MLHLLQSDRDIRQSDGDNAGACDNMIKIFCDKCGREILDGETVRVPDAMNIMKGPHICGDCDYWETHPIIYEDISQGETA